MDQHYSAIIRRIDGRLDQLARLYNMLYDMERYQPAQVGPRLDDLERRIDALIRSRVRASRARAMLRSRR